jgi:hypothetical protein
MELYPRIADGQFSRAFSDQLDVKLGRRGLRNLGLRRQGDWEASVLPGQEVGCLFGILITGMGQPDLVFPGRKLG